VVTRGAHAAGKLKTVVIEAAKRVGAVHPARLHAHESIALRGGVKHLAERAEIWACAPEKFLQFAKVMARKNAQ